MLFLTSLLFCVCPPVKIHPDGMVDAAMDLWMVTMTTAPMGALEGVDPLAMIEVGVAPTVVTGVEARLINHYKMQVGKSYHASMSHYSSSCRVMTV